MRRTTGRVVGVMTSGGDCPGLDAALLAIARGAARHGWRLYGISDGTLGLSERPLRVSAWQGLVFDASLLRRGGTMLGTVSGGEAQRLLADDAAYARYADAFAAGARELGLDALIVIGGDGSMRIVSALCARAGLPMVGVPKTIDNDVHGTDTTIGFASAVQCVADALDRLQPTAASHRRTLVLEVMGREAGHLALHGGIAGGADAIVVPEFGVDLAALALHLDARMRRQRHALVVAAEGLAVPAGEAGRGGAGTWLAAAIERECGVTARATVLGHLQRGGAPCAQDRLLATVLAAHAVALVERGEYARMAAWREGGVGDVPMTVAAAGPRTLAADDPRLAQAANLDITLARPAAGGAGARGSAAAQP